MTPERLIRFYPRAWRERYGEEFVALVRQTGLGPREVLDVVRAATVERVRAVVGASATSAVPGAIVLGCGLVALTAAIFLPATAAAAWLAARVAAPLAVLEVVAVPAASIGFVVIARWFAASGLLLQRRLIGAVEFRWWIAAVFAVTLVTQWAALASEYAASGHLLGIPTAAIQTLVSVDFLVMGTEWLQRFRERHRRQPTVRPLGIL